MYKKFCNMENYLQVITVILRIDKVLSIFPAVFVEDIYKYSIAI